MLINTAKPQGKVSFRVIENADDAFLFKVFESTRAWERSYASWTDEDWDSFMRGQFKAQSLDYARNYISAIHRIMQLDGVDIGRMIVLRNDDLLRLIDLSILPAWRGRGIGTNIVQSLMNEAQGGKVPMRLAVMDGQPAMNLYQRLGFRPIKRYSRHTEMEWQPNLGPREI